MDENGLFTAGQSGGSGTITVSAGGQTKTIKVTVRTCTPTCPRATGPMTRWNTAMKRASWAACPPTCSAGTIRSAGGTLCSCCITPWAAPPCPPAAPLPT
ncbi:MAG: hypothetical protein V8S34_08910 [Lawsonibacter sp.]